MKKLFILSILFLSFSCNKNNKNSIGNNQYAVQDFGELFSDEEKDILTQKIIEFKNSTTNEICVYTIDSVPKKIDDINIFATKLAYDLGLDTSEKKNGLLILISEHDTEFAFATGSDTKKTLTDSIRGKISKNILVPYFSKNEYYNGVSSALDEITSSWK